MVPPLIRSLAAAALLLAAACAHAPPQGAPDLLVVNARTPELLRIDGATGAVEARAPIGVAGHEVTLSPDGRRAYVPIYSDSILGRPGSDGRTIEIYDTATLARLGTIDLGAPVRPHQVAVAPDGLLWVTAENEESVYVVDPEAGTVAARIRLGQPQGHMIALSPDGAHAYTANVSAGTVSAIDTSARRLAATVPVAERVQRLAVSVDGRRIFVHDNAAPRLAVIDSRTHRVERMVPLPDRGYASAPTPDGRRLVTVSPFAKAAYLIALPAMTIERTVPVGHACGTVSIHRSEAFLGCGDGTVVVLDLARGAVARTFALSPGVDGLALVPGR